MQSGRSRRHFMTAFAAGATLTVPAALPLVAAAAERQSEAVSAPGKRARAAGGSSIFDVQRFGAVADGRTLTTAALQRAIDAAGGAGGGLVLIPPGRYLSGALFLRNNVHVYVTAGAVVVGSTRPEDYPPIAGRWEGIERKTHASLFTGEELENVAITGEGVLDGSGPWWWKAAEATRKMRVERGLPREAENPAGAPLRWPRPRLINFIRCQGVALGGLHFNQGPSWNVHLLYCQDALVEGLTLRALEAENCDGIVVDSCRQVRISNCSVATGSDGLSIKSGYNEDGRRVALPSEDIVVTNCNVTMSKGACITLGSETAGGIKNVAIDNCVLTSCQAGVQLKSPRGRGGVVERIRLSNLVMDEISVAGIVLTHYFDSLAYTRFSHLAKPSSETDRQTKMPVDESTPCFRQVDIAGVSMGSVAQVAVVEGLPERYIEGVTLRDLSAAHSKRGLALSRTSEISVSGLCCNPSEGPLVEARDVDRMELHRLRGRSHESRFPVAQLQNAHGFVHGCEVMDPERFVQLEGAGNRVNVSGNSAPWPALAREDGAKPR